uniref:Uncharacterized protein n=1 Tax=Arundo donax TaxID=35708 RepID=A0A0A9C230_ARUDO
MGKLIAYFSNPLLQQEIYRKDFSKFSWQHFLHF